MSHPTPSCSSVLVRCLQTIGGLAVLASLGAGQEAAARPESFRKRALDLRVGADGERVVYRADLAHTGTVKLYLALDPAGELPPLELYGEGAVLADYAFSASGAWVVFRAQDAAGRVELFRVPADGSAAAERLAGGLDGGVADFSLAPWEDRVAFRAAREPGGPLELFARALAGAEPPLALSAGEAVAGYEFAADGSALVLRAEKASAFVTVVRPDGSGRRRLAASALRWLGGGGSAALGSGPPHLAPGPAMPNQAEDVLIGSVTLYTYHAVYGENSYDGRNLVYACLENLGSFIKVVDNVNAVTTTTLISSLGTLAVPGTFRVAISMSGADVACVGMSSPLGNRIHISSDSGLSWQPATLPALTLGAITYDRFFAVPSGHSFGLIDVDYQPSAFYGNDEKLYVYSYQEASAATSDIDRIALVEHVFTPGNLTPASRVIFTGNMGVNCVNTANRICYINAVPTDNGVVLIEGAGKFWISGGGASNAYQSRYAIIPYASGTVYWGYVGASNLSSEFIKDEEIAITYMGRDAQARERVAFMRRKGITSWSSNYGVTNLPVLFDGSSYSFPDTHPSTNPLTSLDSADLSTAGFPTTDLAPLLGDGVGTRTVRDIAANRHTGYVTVFLYGPPNATTGNMEIDDVTSVRFVPGNPVSPSQRSFVNDYTASQAAAAGKTLDCNSIGFDVSSRPDGKITTFFTGSLIPNPTNPWVGKCFLQTW